MDSSAQNPKIRAAKSEIETAHVTYAVGSKVEALTLAEFENLVSLFELLAKWDEEDRRKDAQRENLEPRSAGVRGDMQVSCMANGMEGLGL